MPFNHFAEKTKYKNALGDILDKRIWFSHTVPHFKKEFAKGKVGGIGEVREEGSASRRRQQSRSWKIRGKGGSSQVRRESQAKCCGGLLLPYPVMASLKCKLCIKVIPLQYQETGISSALSGQLLAKNLFMVINS